MIPARAMIALVALVTLTISTATDARYTSSAQSDIFRKHFGCQPCDPSQCPPPAYPGCELIKERGICNCCLVCALREGDSCGVRTQKCETGLVCEPPANAVEPFESLFANQGVCTPSLGRSRCDVINGSGYDVIRYSG